MSKTFHEELCELINKYSLETGSDTPDYIISNYLIHCLDAFDDATLKRDAHFGKFLSPVKDEYFTDI